MLAEAGAAAGVRPAVALIHAVVLGAEGVGAAPPWRGGELCRLEQGLVAGFKLCCHCLLCCNLLGSMLLGRSVEQALLGKTHACVQGSIECLLDWQTLLEREKRWEGKWLGKSNRGQGRQGGGHEANAAVGKAKQREHVSC